MSIEEILNHPEKFALMSGIHGSWQRWQLKCVPSIKTEVDEE